MDCSICLENFNNENMVMCTTRTPTHNHGFCQTCYDDWSTTCTQNHNDVTCPICHILISTYNHDIYNHDTYNHDTYNHDIFEQNSIYEEDIEDNYYYSYENNYFIEYYDVEKTQKIFEVTKINNKFEGVGITYWMNSNIMRISNYMNNKKYGSTKEYNSNGTLYGIEYIYEGYLHGSRKIFNKDGSVNRIESYINGNLINNDFLEEIKNRN